MKYYKIDKIDYKIINELKTNGRQSYAEIADICKISLATVSRRIERLISRNVIKIVAITNDNAFENVMSALVALNVKLNQIDTVCKTLVSNPNVQTLMSTYGRYDVCVVVHCIEEKKFTHFIKNELPLIEGIEHIEIFFINSILKAGGAITDDTFDSDE